MLDQNQYSEFNFLSFDVSTFAPYYVETRQTSNLFAKGSTQVGTKKSFSKMNHLTRYV